MKKYINLLLCGLFVTTFANCNLLNNKAQVEQTQIKVSESKKQSKEDFDKFIVRFHSDSAFQMSRLAESVSGYNWEEHYEKCQNWDHSSNDMPDADEPFVWNKYKLVKELIYGVNVAFSMDKYEKIYKNHNNSCYSERIIVDGENCYFHSEFKLINGNWMLVSLVSFWYFE